MKYLKKIIIDNFQSHLHTELDFELGLNVITGQSDKGKSAILRALKWVLYNEPRGSDFVRFGTNECSVTIITDDGFTVTRKRKGNKNTYIIISPDGEKHESENFGNDVPNEVYSALNMRRIKLDTDNETKINLNEQLDAPFLLSETGTLRAKAIGRIVNTNILDAAERDILKDISNNNLTVKNIEKQITEIDEELSRYGNIEDLEKTISQIDILYEKAVNINSKVQKLRELQQKIAYINESINDNKKTLDSLKPLTSMIESYSLLKEKYSNLHRLKVVFEKLKLLNLEIANNSLSLEKVKNISVIEKYYTDISTKIATKVKLHEMNEKYADINAKISKGNQYTNDLVNELKRDVNNYSNMLKQLGKCPTCFGVINDSTINHIINELEGELHGCK